MKAITSGFEMDSGLDAWKKKWEDASPTAWTSLRGKSITLEGWKDEKGIEKGTQDTGQVFSLQKYHDILQSTTVAMAARSQRMIEFLRNRCQSKAKSNDQRDYDRAPLKAKSYILQEAEAAARTHKMGFSPKH